MEMEVMAKSVFDLYRNKGTGCYIGENVSQIEHATQCAMLAEQEGYSQEVILGAFLHDIGHLLDSAELMVTDGQTLGVRGHEVIGADHLTGLGVPQEVTALVKGHVNAKRYLCAKYPQYRKGLSTASTMTLEHQGGPMTAEEVTQFEQDPHFEQIIRMRKWDEAAKVENMDIEPMEKYEQMLTAVMQNVAIFNN